jgi:saccharopine dehydrogenase (NADP+, L-glutamate forming)
MKNILLLGAGRSATVLIDYLLDNAEKEQWHLHLADISEALSAEKLNGHAAGTPLALNINEPEQRKAAIAKADFVISLLPASFHLLVAETCLDLNKSMVTASYVSPAIEALHQKAKNKGLLVLMECGLDPGIDHMSAMQIIDKIKAEGGEMQAFETFTGGLLAPHPDINPWEYKFTWNPRNVVLAGQGVSKFRHQGKLKYIPYHKLFKRTEVIHVPGYGYFEGYANRDSLKYHELYKLEDVKTLYRGTLRRVGYSRAWDVLVQLGATDDSYELENVAAMSHRDFINSFLLFHPTDSVELKLAHYSNLPLDSVEMFKLKWLGLFSDEPVGLAQGTPAQVLEHILKKQWTLNETDRDMVVMWHKFIYRSNGEEKEIHSHLVAVGEDLERTAMAKTVGLPVGVATKLFLKGELKATGVHTPTVEEIYNPILKELQAYGIKFDETQVR